MTAERAEEIRVSQNGHKPPDDDLEPLPHEVLESPQLKEQIDEGRDRIRQGRTRDGKTSDELLDLAREQRRQVDPRS